MIQLNAEWSELLEDYKREHADPRNQFCHTIGIPLIVGSIPVSLSGVGLPVGLGMFTVGWIFQFVGHAFEGNDPAFFGDSRNLLVGVLWCAQKLGVPVETAVKAKATAEKR